MLISNPIKQIGGNNFIISVNDYGYNINNENLTLDDVLTLYFVNNNLINPSDFKFIQYKNYFFNNDKLIFLNKFNDINDINKNINLLNNVNENFIKNFNHKFTNISMTNIIDFFIKFIAEIALCLNNFNKNDVIFQLYNITLKNNELLNLLNKENNNIIKNIQNCFTQICNTFNINNNLNFNNNNNDIINNNNNIINNNNDIIKNNMNFNNNNDIINNNNNNNNDIKDLNNN